jgi:hypothetical protein
MGVCFLLSTCVPAAFAQQPAAKPGWNQYKDDVSGVVVYVPESWREQEPAPQNPNEVKRLFIFNGLDGKGYQAVALGHVTSNQPLSLEVFSNRVANNLQKSQWEVLDRKTMTVGATFLKSIRIRFFFKSKGWDWRSDMYFFQNGNSYMYLQFLCLDDDYGQSKALFSEIARSAVFVW